MSKCLAGQIIPLRVKGNPISAGRDGGGDCLVFQRAGPGRHFDHTERTDRQAPAQPIDPIRILIGQQPLGRRFIETPRGDNDELQNLSPSRDKLRVDFHVSGPKLLKLVKLAHFGPKNVDNRIAGIDQDPIAMRKPLDPDLPAACRLKPLRQMFGRGADMARRAPAGDNHVIGQRRLTRQANRNDIFGFVFFEGIENELDEFLAHGLAMTMTGQRCSPGWFEGSMMEPRRNPCDSFDDR